MSAHVLLNLFNELRRGNFNYKYINKNIGQKAKHFIAFAMNLIA